MPGHDTADRLRDALEGVRGLVSAYLFGSLSEGREHRQSDADAGVLLDRAVLPAAEARFEARLDLIGRLTRATGRNVDLVILNDAPPPLGPARHVLGSAARDGGCRPRPGASPPGAFESRRPRALPPPRPDDQVAGDGPMTYLVERLAELKRHLDHLRAIAPRATDRAALERDLSLHNDVLFSLLMAAQLVIDIAGDL